MGGAASFRSGFAVAAWSIALGATRAPSTAVTGDSGNVVGALLADVAGIEVDGSAGSGVVPATALGVAVFGSGLALSDFETTVAFGVGAVFGSGSGVGCFSAFAS
jgi:hypothetical protein